MFPSLVCSLLSWGACDYKVYAEMNHPIIVTMLSGWRPDQIIRIPAASSKIQKLRSSCRSTFFMASFPCPTSDMDDASGQLSSLLLLRPW